MPGQRRADLEPYEVAEPPARHASIFEPATLIVGVLMALLGTVIGIQLLTRVGITPNSSIIAAILTIAIARVPLAVFRPFATLDRQNLMQTTISGATFGGANALLLPIGVPWLVGRPDLAPPMLAGAFLALVIDATLLYRVFGSPVYPASGLWPSGIATAETIIAGDRGGRRAALLAAGGVAGGLGQAVGIPMDVFGVCWIGNVWALAMFGLGLLVRGYAPDVLGLDIAERYVPHGIMIGAGVVAIVQMVLLARRARTAPAEVGVDRPRGLERTLGLGFLAFVGAAALLAALAGVTADLAPGRLAGFVLYAALAALASELIVGISAMHAGWFPAFATALIFLVVGMLLGFPTTPLALLVGFTAATGPAFADMGYDLKAGWILRGRGRHPAFERQGRREQYLAELLGFAVAGIVVLLVYRGLFAGDLLPPVDRVFAATIRAGADPTLARALLVWAVPGALLQVLGGPGRQLGVLFATGLLILNPAAGWTAALALAVRGVLTRVYGARAATPMYIAGGGFIAGAAVTGFGMGVWKAR